MTRAGVLAAAAMAALAAFLVTIGALWSVVAHPGSTVAAEALAGLFVSLPFLATGMAGVALVEAEGRVRGPVWQLFTAGWAALLGGLAIAGPLIGPYRGLFGAATGMDPASWAAAWIDVRLWTFGSLDWLQLGLLRLPLTLCAGAILVALAGEAGRDGLRRLTPALPGGVARLRIHGPARLVPHRQPRHLPL